MSKDTLMAFVCFGYVDRWFGAHVNLPTLHTADISVSLNYLAI
mgnify:CR=1 FL=1